MSLGGCTTGPAAVVIVAESVPIRAYPNLKSPDLEADCLVALPDFTAFGSAYVAGAPGCTDFFNDGSTNIPDFTAFGACWGRSCEPE